MVAEKYTKHIAMYCVIVMMLSRLCLVNSVITLEEQSFKIKHGYKLEQGTSIKIINLPVMTSALCASYCPSSCGSATYSRPLSQCITFNDKAYESTIRLSQDSDWEVIYRTEQIRHRNWTLVFRAQKDVNVSIYDSFGTIGRADDLSLSDNTPLSCLRLDSFITCSRHFRSSIVDSWINIDRVRFSIYTNGTEVQYIVFNGTQSTSTSWFSQSAILESSWSALKSDPQTINFNYTGLDLQGTKRRFTICGKYGSCTTDTAYFTVVDVAFDGCSGSWSLPITSFPIFLYSPFNRLVNMSVTPAEYKMADVMAIFVAFRT